MIGWPAIPTGKANWRFAKAPAIGSFASWIKDGCIILLEAIFHNVEKGPTPSSAQQRSPIWKEQWHGSLLAILSNTASVPAWELLLRFYRVDVKGKIIYQCLGQLSELNIVRTLGARLRTPKKSGLVQVMSAFDRKSGIPKWHLPSNSSSCPLHHPLPHYLFCELKHLHVGFWMMNLSTGSNLLVKFETETWIPTSNS